MLGTPIRKCICTGDAQHKLENLIGHGWGVLTDIKFYIFYMSDFI